tara:strand:+ start:220 stop:462 length:243 start_codon:yes stop_codon:yes gene_type:complete
MQTQSSSSQKNQNPNDYLGKSVLNDNSRERRNLEMKRRFQGLQVRRDHLEKELQAVKNCLVSLDMQMKKDEAYTQLILRH